MELTKENETRKTIQFKCQNPEMSKLREYAAKLPEKPKYNFQKTYGKLLDLLDVKVQVGAITVLAQYYDAKLRCFTFSNFQLAPTLEEFALIIGQPLTAKPYHYRGNYPTIGKVVKTLGIDSDWSNYTKAIGTTLEGIPRVWLEELTKKLIQEEKWETLVQVLALSIYDLILFPRGGSFVSPTASDVFMARKCRGESSTFSILADVYYTLHQCHELNGKRIECCLPVLYVWSAAHVLKRKNGSFCPVSKLTNMGSQSYSGKEWKQMFIELDEGSVCWFPLSAGVVRVLFSCGEFPNVPLIGTLGCINYNPVLGLRQLRYSSTSSPPQELLLPFTADLKDEVMIDKIRKAWKNVTYKAEELGTRGQGAATAYKEWVRNRVKEIKLPFQTLTPIPQQETDTVLEESDEVKILKEKLARAESEKEALEVELKDARDALGNLKKECDEKSQSLAQANKRARVEESSRCHISATNQDLREQVARAIGENGKLRKDLEEMEQQLTTLQIQIERQAAMHARDRGFDEQTYTGIIKDYQEHLEEKHLEIQKTSKTAEVLREENWQLKGQIANLEAVQIENQQRIFHHEQELQEIIGQYEERIRKDRLEVKSAISMYRAAIERKNEELRNLERVAGERNHFMGMIRAVKENFVDTWYEVGRWTRKLEDVRRIPRLVRSAETMVNPLTTPREAIELIEVCKRLAEDFEELVQQAKADVVVTEVDVNDA